MLMREIKGARAAMARHSGKDGSARRIGFGREAVLVCLLPTRARLTDRTKKVGVQSLWVTKFARAEHVAEYMSVHSFLTGLRGVLAPVLAFTLAESMSPRTTALTDITLIALASLMIVPDFRLARARRPSHAVSPPPPPTAQLIAPNYRALPPKLLSSPFAAPTRYSSCRARNPGSPRSALSSAVLECTFRRQASTPPPPADQNSHNVVPCHEPR